ncbi:hypothetical protein Sya03_44000 [Spirilliplanes yamanashiensis]|uniref:Septum formation-related domain-containing protein n=2 Tax=Spirilliplanes yamanashiensis TaxID=42233 RepID=A0A8J3YC78_9ACTN|nr:hypothetical protein Sya03_44000 [Spirilliplanes yamanashiensis]
MLVLGVAACAPPPAGTDGAVTDDWPALPAATAFVPAASTCHESIEATGALADYAPVDCSATHRTETFHVGTYTGRAAAAATTPADGAGPAYGDCAKRASGYVGGEWRSAPLAVHVTVPPDAAWEAGARWYRCELTLRNPDDGEAVYRAASLRGALASVAFGCHRPDADEDILGPRLDCTKAHTAEYAGVWTARAGTTWERVWTDEAAMQNGCHTAIARFAKVPDDDYMRYRTGWYTIMPLRQQWEQGERGVRCFLWLDGERLTRSMRGAGTRGLPLN